jgi:hypothetical protein
MKNLFTILLLISILSCSSEKRNKTPLFNELTFELNEGETIGVIDSKIKNKYTEYFNSSLIQVPLFKYIKHDNYEIFIGIPYDTSIEAMVQNQLEKKDSRITTLKSDSLYYYENYKRNDFYIAEYAVKIEGKSLIFIATMSNSKELTDSLFNELRISNRINTNNK